MAQGRAKRPHQKVKTGCMTCRKRRIKCDETKPACRQCTDSLRKCEGYQVPQTWLSKAQTPLEKQDNNTTTTLVQIISPLASLGDSNDRRSFQFWNEQAAPIFSCYFGHSFWTELLPKISVAQPAVKHLLLATSSLVEISALDGLSLDENMVYQSHYTKAIQATCASPQVESVLMACLLFASCEFMKGSVLSGLRHIHSGLNIIDEWTKSMARSGVKASQTARLIIDAIGPIFLAYIDKAPTYGMGDVTISECACTTMIQRKVELPYVGPFTDIHRAYHALDGIAHHLARMMDFRRPAWSPSSPQKIQILLDTWHMYFEAFEANMMESWKQRYTLTLQLLRVHYTMLTIMLRGSSSKNETIYQQFAKEFKWIADMYDNYSVAWVGNESSKSLPGPALFDYHMGFISPLFLTAIKCRDPATRMAALKHLGSLGVVENNWTSCTAYVVARKIIKIEDTRSILNKRAGLKDERDLIRPIEVSITDNRKTQAGLEFVAFPYGSSPVMQETFDLQYCSSSTSARWPLSRIVRIGGYQGGGVKPVPAKCSCGLSCGLHSPKDALMIRPKK